MTNWKKRVWCLIVAVSQYTLQVKESKHSWHKQTPAGIDDNWKSTYDSTTKWERISPSLSVIWPTNPEKYIFKKFSSNKCFFFMFFVPAKLIWSFSSVISVKKRERQNEKLDAGLFAPRGPKMKPLTLCNVLLLYKSVNGWTITNFLLQFFG